MKKMHKQKGITLIALVITIVLLLILAGISISSLTNSGLFEKAKEAEQKSKEAQEKEEGILADYEKMMNKYLSGTGSSEKKLTDTEDTKPSQAIPTGATVIENDASKGIVISDSKSNQWVWVEVPITTVFKKATSSTDYTNIKADLVSYVSKYRSTDYDDNYLEGLGIADSATYTTMYNKMLSSVYTNGGFWISRYEIGDSTATANNATRARNSGTAGIAVSQANQIPYNYVQSDEAQILASGMSTDKNQTSSLLFGIQWDLTCKFIEENTELELSDINSNSTEWGNFIVSSLKLNRGKYNISPNTSTSVWEIYTTDIENYVTSAQTGTTNYILLTTGASEQANKMNIYDFAGNEGEWTLETRITSGEGIAVRGNAAVPEIMGAAVRIWGYFGDSDYDWGFRSTLY